MTLDPKLKHIMLAAALLVAAACQSPPAKLPRAAVTGADAQAAEALQKGDYARAAVLYRQALEQEPERLALHYGLAVATSYLDLKDETGREFKWVLDRGVPGSVEVESARGWLTRAGLLPQPFIAAASFDDGREPGNGSLEGHAVFAEAGQEPKPMRRMQLFLVGQPDSPTQKERYNLRTNEDGSFKFPDVVPGPYKLTNRVAGRPIWRLRIELKPSETKVLELTPGNSTASQDDFPEQQAQAKE